MKTHAHAFDREGRVHANLALCTKGAPPKGHALEHDLLKVDCPGCKTVLAKIPYTEPQRRYWMSAFGFGRAQ